MNAWRPARQVPLFDLDAVAPRVEREDDEGEDDEDDEGDCSQGAVADKAAALRQQLRARALRPPPPGMELSEGRVAMDTAGRMLLQHGDGARWALTLDDSMPTSLRRRVDALLAQAGLQPVHTMDLPTIA